MKSDHTFPIYLAPLNLFFAFPSWELRSVTKFHGVAFALLV